MQSFDFLRDMFDKLDIGVKFVDANGIIQVYNRAFAKYLGFSSENVIGKKYDWHFAQLNGLFNEESIVKKVIRTKEPIIGLRQSMVNSIGKKLDIVTSVYPIYSMGTYMGVLEISQSIDLISDLYHQVFSMQNKLSVYNQKAAHKPICCAKYTIDDIISSSPAMSAIKQMMIQTKDSMSNVLVYGETGTGKEMLVQAIHNLSSKTCNGPFIAQNCAAIPNALLESLLFGTVAGSFTGSKNMTGLFEQANHGTLFLDEINLMSINLQSKLLRAIQERTIRRVGDVKEIPVNVRLITAMNIQPEDCVANNTLREDLYYRLNVLSYELPPLRQRAEDIPILVKTFIQQYNNELQKNIHGISDAALEQLMACKWPGNI